MVRNSHQPGQRMAANQYRSKRNGCGRCTGGRGQAAEQHTEVTVPVLQEQRESHKGRAHYVHGLQRADAASVSNLKV